MMKILHGFYAGAAGTTALNIVTYFDMLITGRPASSTPETLVQRMAASLGCMDLAKSGDDVNAAMKQTQSTVGTLLGYANGIGVGMLGAHVPIGNVMLRGILLGAVAMAASDIPIAKYGVSDPKTWTTTDWLRDAIPHLCYGLVTAATLHAMEE